MNKKKALPRKSYSVERTLKDLIDEIGYEGIEIATGKKKIFHTKYQQPHLQRKTTFPPRCYGS